MNPYADVDDRIKDWAEKYRLILQTRTDNPARWVWLSSKAGECFQIWIEHPENGTVKVGAVCIEGRRDDDEPDDWDVPTTQMALALDEAYKVVVHWMRPSTHFHPVREQ